MQMKRNLVVSTISSTLCGSVDVGVSWGEFCDNHWTCIAESLPGRVEEVCYITRGRGVDVTVDGFMDGGVVFLFVSGGSKDDHVKV